METGILRLNRASWWILAVAAVFILLSAALGFHPAVHLARLLSPDGILSNWYVGQLIRSQIVVGVLLLAAAPFAAWWPAMKRHVCNRPCFRRDRLFAAYAAALATTLSLVILFGLFDSMPHVTDATCHYFQAKIFSSGRMYAPVPACYEFFVQHNMIMTADGKWFARYPPGTALLLACGFVLHLGWLMLPLATGLAVASLFYLARTFYSPVTARSATVLFALSPLSLLLGASYMSHIPFLAFFLLGLAVFFAMRSGRARGRIARWIGFTVAGSSLGFSALCRPQDFALLGVVCILGWAWSPRSTWWGVATDALRMLPGLMLAATIMLYANAVYYGNPFALGYGFSEAGSLVPGIRVSYGFSEGFTVAEAGRNFIFTMTKLNQALFGWPCSFFFVPLLLFARDIGRRECFAVMGAVFLFGFFFFYSYPALEYEARFYLLATPLLAVLTVRGVQGTIRLAGQLLRGDELGAQSLVAGVLFAFVGYALVEYWPRHIVPTYAGDYEQASPVIHRIAIEQGLKDAIVLIRAEGKDKFRYSSGFPFNDPRLTNSVIYARDLPGKNRCLKEHFPDRTVYRFIQAEGWQTGRFEPLSFE